MRELLPVPRLGTSYDLLSIDTATRYRHPGLVRVHGLEWKDSLCYDVTYPTYAHPLPPETLWDRALAALRWLHSQGRALSGVSIENIFAAVDEDGKIYAVLYVGENVVEATPEHIAQNIAELQQYGAVLLPDILEGSEESGALKTSEVSGTLKTSEVSGTLKTSEESGALKTSEESGTSEVSESLKKSEESDSCEDPGEVPLLPHVVWDYHVKEKDLSRVPTRNEVKEFLSGCFSKFGSWKTEHMLYALDIFHRLHLVSDCPVDVLKNVAIHAVERTFSLPSTAAPQELQRVLERHLLISFSGVFFSPLRCYLHKKEDFLLTINRICLNFNTYVYFLAIRDIARNEEPILHMTLTDALSKT